MGLIFSVTQLAQIPLGFRAKSNYVSQICQACSDLKHTFRSKCLSKRVRASVSPPGHTAEGRPSVSKPERQIE